VLRDMPFVITRPVGDCRLGEFIGVGIPPCVRRLPLTGENLDRPPFSHDAAARPSSRRPCRVPRRPHPPEGTQPGRTPLCVAAPGNSLTRYYVFLLACESRISRTGDTSGHRVQIVIFLEREV